MKSVWSCNDQESAVYVCARLRAAGIPFKVSQSKHQFWRRVDERYEVFVPPELHDKAKQIAEQGNVDFSDTPEDQKIMELGDVDPELAAHGNTRGTWHEEDVTVEVWSEKTENQPWFEKVEGIAWIIELSLRENGICTRIDKQQDGYRRIFVLPGDELRAREIVHEIAEGTPPA